MNGNKLDEIDIRILGLLQQDARMGIGRIGRLVGLSESPVTNRIEKMEEAGIIQRYVAVLNREKTTRPVMVVLLVKLKDPSAQLFSDFEQLVTAMSEVQSCLLISGNWNFLLHVTATTPQAYAVWIMEKILCHSFIADVESAYLMKECKSFGKIEL
jgi:Lrp/AsnC family leucine-responsive transcriptional regulator